MKYAGMPMGMCVLMKELGLYDLTPALCRLERSGRRDKF